jgi:hypothetical protein
VPCRVSDIFVRGVRWLTRGFDQIPATHCLLQFDRQLWKQCIAVQCIQAEWWAASSGTQITGHATKLAKTARRLVAIERRIFAAHRIERERMLAERVFNANRFLAANQFVN